jgi:hypothetical protein
MRDAGAVATMYDASFGEVSEWLMEPVSKTGVRATVPRVRIPPSPVRLQRTVRVSSRTGEQERRATLPWVGGFPGEPAARLRLPVHLLSRSFPTVPGYL